LQNALKGIVFGYTHTPDASRIGPYTTRDTTTTSKMGPMIVVGLRKLCVLRQNPPVGSALPRANRARDKATKMVASS
jgi:hypothetical protein